MKLITNVLCLLVFQQFCFGQQIIIDYDWKEGKFVTPFPDYIKEGSSISIRYVNINRFAFEFNPTTFTPINRDFQDGADKIIAGLALLAGEESTTEAAGKAAAKAVDDAQKAKGKALLPAKEKTNTFWEERLTLLRKIEIKFNSIQENVLQISNIMTLEVPIKMAWNDPGIFDATTMFNRLFRLVDGINDPADIVKQTAQHLSEIKNTLSDINSAIITLENLPDANEQKLTPEQSKSNTALIAALRKKTDELTTLYSGNNLKTIQENAFILFDKSNVLLSTNFVSLPRNVGFAEGDFLQVHDVIKYNEGKTSFTIDKKLKTTGGTRVDFSVGLAVNIGGNGAEYSLRKNPTNIETGADTANVILYENKKNKLLQFSPVILVHWYKTTIRSCQWMLTTGLAPDFSTLANSRIFFGGSVGLPASNSLTRRLVLSLGFSAGYADVLKSEYKDWKNYKRFAAVKDADLTTKVVRPGGFFSVTYNLGGPGHESQSSAK